MNIQSVFEELEKASSFDLFRVKTAIEKLLEDPERIDKVRKKLTVGMQLDFFDEDQACKDC